MLRPSGFWWCIGRRCCRYDCLLPLLTTWLILFLVLFASRRLLIIGGEGGGDCVLANLLACIIYIRYGCVLGRAHCWPSHNYGMRAPFYNDPSTLQLNTHFHVLQFYTTLCTALKSRRRRRRNTAAPPTFASPLRARASPVMMGFLFSMWQLRSSQPSFDRLKAFRLFFLFSFNHFSVLFLTRLFSSDVCSRQFPSHLCIYSALACFHFPSNIAQCLKNWAHCAKKAKYNSCNLIPRVLGII